MIFLLHYNKCRLEQDGAQNAYCNEYKRKLPKAKRNQGYGSSRSSDRKADDTHAFGLILHHC